MKRASNICNVTVLIFLQPFCSFSPHFLFCKPSNLIHLFLFTSDSVTTLVKLPRKAHRHLCVRIYDGYNNWPTQNHMSGCDLKQKKKNGIIPFFDIWPCLTEVQANVNERSSSLIWDVWSSKNTYFSFPPWKAWVQADPYIKIYQRKSFDGTLKWKEPCDWASDVLKLKNIVQPMFQCLRV